MLVLCWYCLVDVTEFWHNLLSQTLQSTNTCYPYWFIWHGSCFSRAIYGRNITHSFIILSLLFSIFFSIFSSSANYGNRVWTVIVFCARLIGNCKPLYILNREAGRWAKMVDVQEKRIGGGGGEGLVNCPGKGRGTEGEGVWMIYLFFMNLIISNHC